MSFEELHYGILTEVNLKNKTVEEWCKDYMDSELPEIYSDYVEYFVNTRHNYKYLNGKLYHCDDHNLSKDMCEMNKISESKYSYTVQFYNGGTCLDEVLEQMLQNEVE